MPPPLMTTVMTTQAVALVAAAYVVGSLPMGLFVGRLRGVDLREHGSRNIGATNAGRVLGKPWFFVVFVLDFAKGWGPVLAARKLEVFRDEPGLAIAAGVAAVLGHVFSIFLKFKGGKGVATAAGVFMALAPMAAAIAFVVWLLVAKGSGYVSVASLAAAVALPLACWLLPKPFEVGDGVRWMALLVGALIVFRHRANIGRLLRGQEPRAR